MRPILLKIKGLNSFIEEQLIDFSRLTERGLFGIFGPTGSGKSTVLDAMTLALYGRVPRADGRLSGIVNSLSDKTVVYYEFSVNSGGKRDNYYVQRILRKKIDKKTGSESIKTEEAIMVYLDSNTDPEPIAEGQRDVNEKVTEIIGLNGDDFTRSVVLPQGKFSEFLRLSGTERREMLERIFGLEKYGEGMSREIKRLKNLARQECDRLEGSLSNYLEISADKCTELKEDIEKGNEKLKKMVKDVEHFEEFFLKARTIWDLRQKLKFYQEESRQLKSREKEFLYKETILEKAEKAAFIKPRVDRIKQQKKDLESKEQKIKAVEQELAEITSSLFFSKKKWDNIEKKKDIDFPFLISKENNLKRAVIIKKEIKELEDEIHELISVNKKIETELKKKNDKLGSIIDKIEESNASLEIKIKRINTLRVSSEEREQLMIGDELEKEYKTISKLIKDLQTKLEVKRKNIENLNEDNTVLENTIQEKEIIEKEILQIKDELGKNCPGDSNDLLAAQKLLNELYSELKELVNLLGRKTEVQSSLKELSEQRMGVEKKLYRENDEILQFEAELEKISAEISANKDINLAVILAEKLSEGAACPVCGAIHHPMLASRDNMSKIEVVEIEEKQKMAEVQEKRAEFIRLDIKFKNLKIEEEKKKDELKLLEEQRSGRKLSSCEEKVKDKERNFEVLQEEIDKWNKEKQENDNKLEKIKNEILDFKNKQLIKENDLKRDKEELFFTNEELRKLEEKSRKVKIDYDILRDKLGLESLQESYKKMINNDREIESEEKEKEKLRVKIGHLDKDKQQLLKIIKDLDIQIRTKEESGRGKGINLQNKTNELNSLNPGDDPDIELTKVQQEIINIKNDYDLIKKTYEQELEKEKILSHKYSTLQESNLLLNQAMKEEEDLINKDLHLYGFINSDEVLDSYREKKEIDELIKNVKEYQNKVNINSADMNRIITELKGENISDNEWKTIQEKREKNRKELENLKNEFILKQSEFNNLQDRLKEKGQILDLKKNADQRYGLLEEMENLFKGKKFVEFIARKQLRYIAREASYKLKDISRGRYALELNAEGNFIIRDDFNGGNRRPSHTLSGGETFLTSLSLALALSSSIQLGKASLEFFFLDEGFGTLDSETLDLLMNSLARLQSEKLSVGIISHVEELKERIPRKLIVKPALAGICGTRVEIEES